MPNVLPYQGDRAVTLPSPLHQSDEEEPAGDDFDDVYVSIANSYNGGGPHAIIAIPLHHDFTSDTLWEEVRDMTNLLFRIRGLQIALAQTMQEQEEAPESLGG